VTGLTLDAGALIAIERRSKAMLDILEAARADGRPLAIPAGVLAQVWRGGRRQVPLARFLNTRVTGDKAAPIVEPMHEMVARWTGEVCARTGTSDVVDASVVVCARMRGHAVVTSDPQDVRRLDPGLALIVI
jgi:hypothetical protein